MGFLLKSCVSEMCVKQILVNQGVGVLQPLSLSKFLQESILPDLILLVKKSSVQFVVFSWDLRYLSLNNRNIFCENIQLQKDVDSIVTVGCLSGLKRKKEGRFPERKGSCSVNFYFYPWLKSRTIDAQWSLFPLNYQTFGLGQTIWAEKFWGIWGIFG